jgi:hypothetical protein
LDESGLVGGDDGLDAVSEVELHQDPGDVRLDGRVADEELACDLGVREPAREEPEHLELARGELLHPLGLVAERRAACELGDQPTGDGWCEERLAAGDDTDCGDELRGGRVLEQKAARAGA